MTLPFYDGKWINCISLSVNQNIMPLSTATMTLLKDDALPIRSYVEITTPNGVKEYYRSRQPQTAHGTEIATIQLDHAICEVGDYIVQAEINEEKTVAQAMAAIFAHYRGNKWQLGTFTATETVTIDCDHDNVLESMLAILEQVPQYMMVFNFNTNPWTVSIAEKPNTVTAEGRLSRNISDDVVKYDDKDLCTRVYVSGLPSPGYMDSDTISTYGIIETQTGSGNLTQAQAQRLATTYLNAHKNPKVSIEIDGEDLSDITGETLDSFVVGKKFRLAVPKDNLVLESYITKVSYSDVINSNQVNIVVGDDLDATLNFLQNQASKSKSYGKSIRNQGKENAILHTEIYATGSMLYSYTEQTATYILAVVENVESSLGSAILQTANQIRSEVHASDSQLYSYIDQTATYIEAVVADVANDLGSAILQTASQIRSEVHASNSELYSYVDQTATYIESVVADTANDLGSAILQTASQIRSEVHASNSALYSYVDQTATYIETVVADTANSLGSAILQTASQIRSEVHAADSAMYSYIDQTASGIQQEVANTTSGLSSRITQQADKISIVVDSSNHIKAAAIAASINHQTGQSAVKISADKVDIDGSTIVDYLEGAAIGVQSIMADEIILNGGGRLLFYSDSEIGSTEASSMIVDAYVEDDILHLVHYNGAETTFRKAASTGTKVSGSWSGSNLTVAVSPTGTQDSYSTNITTGFVTNTLVSPWTYHITAYHQDNGAQQVTEIQSARLQFQLGVLESSPNVVRILNAAGSTFINGTPSYTIPSPTVNTWSMSLSSAPYTYHASVKVNGTTYTSGDLYASDAYANGWSGCYSGVGLDSTAAKTLSYGESVTVYAQAYQSNSAQAKTNVASRTLTAPADRYSDGQKSITPNLTCDTTNDKFVATNPYDTSKKKELLVNQAFESASGGTYYITTGYKAVNDQYYSPVIRHTVAFNTGSVSNRQRVIRLNYNGTDQALTYTCTDYGDGYTLGQSEGYSSGQASVTPNLVYNSSVTGFVASNPYDSSKSKTLNVDADFIRENNIYYIRVAYKAPSDQGYASAKRNVIKLGLATNSNTIQIKNSSGTAYSGSPTVTVSTRFYSKKPSGYSSNVTCIEARVYSYSDGDGTKSASGGEVFYKLGFDSSTYTSGTTVQVQYSGGSGTEGSRIPETSTLSLTDYWNAAVSNGRSGVTPNLAYDSSVTGFVASNPYNSSNKKTLNVKPMFNADSTNNYICVGYKAPSDQGYAVSAKEVIKMGLRSSSNVIILKDSSNAGYSQSPTASVSARFYSKQPSGYSSNVTCIEARVYSASDGGTKSASGGEVFYKLGFDSSSYSRNTMVQVQYAGGSGTEGSRISDTSTLPLTSYFDYAYNTAHNFVLMGANDSSGHATFVTSRTIGYGQTVDVWAAFRKYAVPAGDTDPSNYVYGSKTTFTSAYTHTISVRQQVGYASARKMKMFYQDNMGNYQPAANGSSMYWYYSNGDLNNTASYKALYY